MNCTNSRKEIKIIFPLHCFENVCISISCFMLATAMANKMNLFKFVCKTYELTGIYPYQSDQTGSYNWRNVTVLLPVSMMFITSTAIFLFQAISFQEFGSSFFASTTALAIIVLFLNRPIYSFWYRNVGNSLKTVIKTHRKNQTDQIGNRLNLYHIE